MDSFLSALGDEVTDVDEETFYIFSQDQSSSQDLGMVDARAEEVELSINGRDFTIKQSPGVLQSKREGGTTGAALWRACVLFAEWLSWPKNPLFHYNLLGASSTVLELGSGISGLVPLLLSSRVERVVATDQQYALKLLRENVSANVPVPKLKPSKGHISKQQAPSTNLDILPLDWETSDISSFLRSNNLQHGVDAVLVCDCIFNYALIEPLVQTCKEICRARSAAQADALASGQPTICIIAQQLRQPDVFEQWLKVFMAKFRVWRAPDQMLKKEMHEGSGYVVHFGILRDEKGV